MTSDERRMTSNHELLSSLVLGLPSSSNRSKYSMNNQAEIAKRRALAEIVAPEYAANPKVAGVLLAGSVARGLADGFSDIEIDIYWHTPPTDQDRRAPIERADWQL